MLVVFAGHGSPMVAILEAKNIQDLKGLITALIEGNEDIWKVELLENYRKARLKNWIIIPPILFSLMFLFFVMGMLFTAPAANIYNCYNLGFGALCDCMFFEHIFRSNFRDERLYD